MATGSKPPGMGAKAQAPPGLTTTANDSKAKTQTATNPAAAPATPPAALQKAVVRRVVDYTAPYLKLIQARLLGSSCGRWDLAAASGMPLPVYEDTLQLLPPAGYLHQPASAFPTQLVSTNTGKVKSSVNCVLWLRDGRRCITGASSGEFEVWDGKSFTMETILQAHENCVRSLAMSHSEHLIISSDDNGRIKLWNGRRDHFLDPMLVIPAHKEPCRSVTISPTDRKFASGSDDSTIKVFDVATAKLENNMQGHGGDVRWVAWHPCQGLLASGSKDALVKLWDPRAAGVAVATLHGHKNGIMQVKWNPHNDHWVLSCAKDQTLKVYDIRRLREIATYQGHGRDVTSCAWHPVIEEAFVSGAWDGTMMAWLMSRPDAITSIKSAHEREVWDVGFHPMGHVMCSVGADYNIKFWCRARPGDIFKDPYEPNPAEEAISRHLAASTTTTTAAAAGPATATIPMPGGSSSAAAVPAVVAGGGLASLGLAAKIPGLGSILSKVDQHLAGTASPAAITSTAIEAKPIAGSRGPAAAVRDNIAGSTRNTPPPPPPAPTTTAAAGARSRLDGGLKRQRDDETAGRDRPAPYVRRAGPGASQQAHHDTGGYGHPPTAYEPRPAPHAYGSGHPAPRYPAGPQAGYHPSGRGHQYQPSGRGYHPSGRGFGGAGRIPMTRDESTWSHRGPGRPGADAAPSSRTQQPPAGSAATGDARDPRGAGAGSRPAGGSSSNPAGKGGPAPPGGRWPGSILRGRGRGDRS